VSIEEITRVDVQVNNSQNCRSTRKLRKCLTAIKLDRYGSYCFLEKLSSIQNIDPYMSSDCSELECWSCIAFSSSYLGIVNLVYGIKVYQWRYQWIQYSFIQFPTVHLIFFSFFSLFFFSIFKNIHIGYIGLKKV